MTRAQWHDRIYMFSLVAILLTMPYGRATNSIPILLLVGNWLLSGNWASKRERWNRNKTAIAVLTGIYVVQLVSVLWTSELSRVPTTLQTRLGLLVLPLIIGTAPPWSAVRQLRLMATFVLSCLVAALICHSDALLRLYEAGAPISDIFTGYYTYGYLVEVIGINPIYMSMYLVLAIFLAGFLLTRLRYLLPAWQKWGLRLIMVYLLFFIVHLGARMGLLTLVGLGGVALLKRLLSGRRQLATLLGVGAAVAVIVAVLLVNQRTERFINMFEPISEEHTEVLQPMADMPLRIAIWYAAWEVIREAPLLGIGMGDTTEAMVEQFERYHFTEATEKRLNTHNQYLAHWMMAGIPGLIALLLYVLMPLRWALARRDPMYLVVVLLVALTFVTENLLSQQRGVVFVAFFFALFTFYDPATARLPQEKTMDPD